MDQSLLPHKPKQTGKSATHWLNLFYTVLFCGDPIRRTHLSLGNPKLEHSANRFQLMVLPYFGSVLNSIWWWHFGFKFCALAPWSVNFQTHPAAHPTRNLHQHLTKEDNIHFVVLRRITSTQLIFNLPSPSENGEVRQQPQFGMKKGVARFHARIVCDDCVISLVFCSTCFGCEFVIVCVYLHAIFFGDPFWWQHNGVRWPRDDVSIVSVMNTV